MQYGSVLSQAVATTLRMLHEKIVRPEQSDIILHCTQTQLWAAVGLYRAIIEGMDTPDEAKLLPSLHDFLDSLLRSGELPVESMSFPTEFVIFLLSNRSDGAYSMASAVASNCAALRYCLLSIFTHVARCRQAGLKAFEWFEKSKPSGPLVGVEEDKREDVDVNGKKFRDNTQQRSEPFCFEDDNIAGKDPLGSPEGPMAWFEEDIEDVLESIMDGVCFHCRT